MRATEAVRKVMEEKEVSLSNLAARLEKGITVVSERLRQENISVSKLRELLRVMDYKVVIMPRDVSTPKGGIEIE